MNNTVLTAPARQGIFRFYPGVQNANATAAVPTVDLGGNPVQPANATGPLQSVGLFGRDPNRLVRGSDREGRHRARKTSPLPNNFQRGDGLNAAGFYWQEPRTDDFNLYNLKIDHTLTQSTRLAFSMQANEVQPVQRLPRPGFSAAAFGFRLPHELPLHFLRTPPRYGRICSMNFTPASTISKPAYSGPFYPDQNSVLPHVGSQPFFFMFLTISE